MALVITGFLLNQAGLKRNAADTGTADRDELVRLHKSVSQHSGLRWIVALAIAQSDEIRASTSRLTWGASCIVSFDKEDLQELTLRANDTGLPADEREVWFAAAVYVAFKGTRRRERANALRELRWRTSWLRLRSRSRTARSSRG